MPFTWDKGTSLFMWRLPPTHSHPATPPPLSACEHLTPVQKKLVSHENKIPGGGLTVSESQGHKSFFRMLRKSASGQIPQLPKETLSNNSLSMFNFPRPLIISKQHIHSSRNENIPQTVSLKAIFKARSDQWWNLGCGHAGGLFRSSTYISVQVLADFSSVHFASCCHAPINTQFHQKSRSSLGMKTQNHSLD